METKTTDAVRECQGLQSPHVDDYDSKDPAYLLQHWDKFRGCWRSKGCSLFVPPVVQEEQEGQEDNLQCRSCSSCRDAKNDVTSNLHPMLFSSSSFPRVSSRLSWLRFAGTLVLAALCGYLHYAHVSALHENHSHFSHLSTLERELYFRTEMGFYYSYYKQIVQAPTFSDGFKSLMSDELTEFPSTINALSRFNLYPEVILAAAYRGYIDFMDARGLKTKTCFRVRRGDAAPPIQSCVGLGEPACFYSEGIFWLSGLMMAGFFLLAYFASGGMESAGLIAVAAYFFNHDECTRVMWTPPLRESFSYPFFVWQQLALLYAIKNPRAPLRLVFLTATSLLFLLSWQFAQFVLVLQACALFGSHLLGSLDAPSLRLLLTSILAGGVLSSALQFGNTMLITGLFPAGLLSMLTLSFARLDDRLNKLHQRFITGVCLLAALMLGVKYVLASIAGTAEGGGDDSHIWDLLLAKFDPRFHTFDTKLYLCAREFGFYEVSSLVKLSKSLVLPTALAAVVMSIFRLPRVAASDRAPLLVMLLQVAALAVLAGLISRLKVLFTPQLILTASLLFHEKLCPVKYRQGLAVALIAGMAIRGIPTLQKELGIVGEYSNNGLEEVVHWILKNTEPFDSFVGPMTIMATVRVTTFRPIYNHPHYEDAGLRRRTRQAYSMYSRKPLDEIYNIHKEIGARYIVAERHLCFSGRTGCRYRDKWDAEDLVNIGNRPVCETLFGDEPGGLEPYFRKVFENREFTILERMDMAECAVSTDISDSGSEGATSCSSPFFLPPSKKYLLYKVNSGEGFNLQRNVGMRVAHMMMGFEDSHNYTLVLPPFANSIHWSDRSTHTFGTFFDLEILREAVDSIDLEEFLSDRVQRIPSVDTVVHLSVKDDLKDPEVVTWQPDCTPELVTSENSRWPNELRVKMADTESPVAPYEGSMLGHIFPVRRLVCLKVRFDMHGKDLASKLSAIFDDSSSVLIDNAARISWGTTEGEGHTGYYKLLASWRFKPHVHHAALDFMETRNFSQDFVAVHMRRNDFLHVRPDVPTPAEVGVQLAVVVRNMLLKGDWVQSPTLPPPKVSVFVASDSVDLLGDITQLRDSLNASLERRMDAAISADVVFFTAQANEFEDGELALIDQIICASATDFVGSNSSYFTKTVSEERLLLGKSIHSTYSVLCATGTNKNTRCEADLDSCLTCMNGWLPKLSGEMGSLLSSAEMRNQKGLFERYYRVPAVGANETDEAQIDRSVVEIRTSVCFVIMSQHGSPRDEKAGESLRSRLQSENFPVFLLHSDLPAEAQSKGLWTFLPLLRYFSDGGCGGDDASGISWYIFIPPDVSVDVDGLSKTLKSLDASQPLFVGHALQDEKASICHHFNMDFDFKYPSLDASFGITQSLLRRLLEDSVTGHAFHIDPSFELAKHIQEVAGVALTNLSLASTRESYDAGRRKPWDERPASRSIFVAVKTTLVNHSTRVPIIKRVWTDAAARSGAIVVFYSETRDDSIPTVYGGITNSEKVKGEAKKLMAIFQHAAKAFVETQGKDGHDSPLEWLLIADDDTLVNFDELRRILADYDPSVPLLIGDRYAYGHGMGRGYDYLTGGAGTVLSSQALQMIVERREVDGDACGTREDTDTPDDMWLGRCAQRLGIPLVNEPGFHQARPSDYNTATISLHPHVSFHRFKDTNEALEISRTYLGGHFDNTGR
jgi:hypothetical protein